MDFFPKGIRMTQKNGLVLEKSSSWTPERVLIPLYPKGIGLVPVGTRVKKGALLGEEGGFAPENGILREYRELNHPMLGKVLCAGLELELEKKKKEQRRGNPQLEGARKPEDILKAARHSGILEECSGELLWKQMEHMMASPPELIAADALDDDPIPQAGAAFFIKEKHKVIRGLTYLSQALGGVQERVAWNSRWVGEAMEDLPARYSLRLKNRYPAWEIFEESHRGAACRVGVQALAALADASERQMPQTHTVITVGGDAFAAPRLCKVPIGTPVGDLLEHCGIGARPCQAVMGSALSGYNILDPDTPVIASTRCIVVWRPTSERLDDRVFPCIGCGKCQRACPKGLEPWVVQDALGQDPIPENMLWNVEACTQCGVCRAVCPSGIDLLACMRQAAELRKRGGLV